MSETKRDESGATGFRTGTVAIVGRPNVGKSTLLNALVGQHVAITSRKAQTTRHRIHGVFTDNRSQFIFVDTPGFQMRHQNALNRGMNRTVRQVMGEVDAIVMVVEAWQHDVRDDPILEMLPAEIPVILALNKVDRIKDREKFAQALVEWNAKRDFAALVPVSAEKGTQLKSLLWEIRKHLPVAPPVFDAEDFTDRSERFLAAELVRERIFRLLGDELPYSTAVVIEAFETEPSPTNPGGFRRITATIFVDRDSHKAIVIGEKGASLKRIGTEARHAMEALFGGKVHLELWVRVKGGWADNEAMLRQLGYE
ncbi:GTPase Era [Betaproteobacteria bacterium GR16-43]|nr:GTPase Era [Betaproteobacteria bacterium GR16-43]